MSFNKDNKKSPFSLNISSSNSSSPFSLSTPEHNEKSPFSLSSSSKPTLSTLNNNKKDNSSFLVSSNNFNTNKSSPFSLQTNNTKPLLNQLNSTTEKPSLFSLQSDNVIKPALNNNNSENSKPSLPFMQNLNNNGNNNNSPFSLFTNSDKKLISPFSLSNANSNSPFTLNQNNNKLIINNQNDTKNSSPLSLPISSKSTIFNNNLEQTTEKKSSPFTLQNNSQPLSSMINDSKPSPFTLHSSNNDINDKNNTLSLSLKGNKTEKPSRNDGNSDLTKKPNVNPIESSIFASFNITNNKKSDRVEVSQDDNNLIAKPSGFAKFLLDMDEEDNKNSNVMSSKVISSMMIINDKKDDIILKSPSSQNILLDLDEESANKEAISKLSEIHKLFRNTSPYYLLNFIDWDEEEDNKDNYLYEEEIKEYTGKDENESEEEIQNQDTYNEKNEKDIKISHKLFRFDTPSPDDIVIISREKGKKDARDINARSNKYKEKKNEKTTNKNIKQSNIEISSDHVIRIGALDSNSGLSKNSSLNSSRSSLSNDDEEYSMIKEQNPNGFNFKYRNEVLANAFPSENELFETEEEKAENDYYKYYKFEDENAKIVETYYPPIPDPLPAKYNSVYYHKLNIENELQKRKNINYRKALHITCLGPLRSGKSTLLGRIYEELILKPNNSLREVKKIEKELQRRNQTLERRYAWLMDESKIEKERNTTLGVTTDFSVNYKNREIVIYDTPGHTDYISTTITELYNTDIILLMVDASSENINNECDIAIIKDYLFLCKCIGIQDVIVVINKMEKVKYSEIIYQKLQTKIQKIVEQFKFKNNHVYYVPCDGLNAENIFEKSINPLLNWYQGKSIFDYLDDIDIIEEQEITDNKSIIDTPFRMVVKDYMRENGISGSSVTVEGRISYGIIQVGENIFTTPNYDVPFVRAIECNGQLVKYAVAGDYVRIGLGNIDITKISKNAILCSIDNPIKLVNKFKAQILVNSSSIPIIKGTNAIMYINNNQESVFIKKIKMKKVKLENNKVIKRRTTIIPKNTITEVIIQLHDKRRIPIQTYTTFRHFGRFILQHDSEIIASGIVLES
ncbi:hypothetical protein BCR36DRAFT_334196 [Piromyces finnis]|uniref:Uncharacterized protein n=1 Tax=Piromyces finnis TaxID=1754191 RepID=A0A1Y1V1S0_9FUNG|nr:hypothetical protein BCR36DRAFT_334196 [Piromyces finnis]|eukprot:ORX44643.1 hypothetical protein BCR36DRAFT_334196 [Piromyces finnis]